MHIPAPKMVLPGHAESYNPPSEYLFSKEELDKWQDTEVEDRRQNFVPQKYSSMRAVPAYKRFINERFERCLDLYLCPRQQKMRVSMLQTFANVSLLLTPALCRNTEKDCNGPFPNHSITTCPKSGIGTA